MMIIHIKQFRFLGVFLVIFTWLRRGRNVGETVSQMVISRVVVPQQFFQFFQSYGPNS